MTTPQKKRAQSGFTLIEIAIIIAVVAILGAVGATRFANLTADAQKAATSNALSNLRSGLAIAIAKNPNAAITMTTLNSYVDPALTADTNTSFKWIVNGTTYTVNVDVSKDDVRAITSVSDGTNTIN